MRSIDFEASGGRLSGSFAAANQIAPSRGELEDEKQDTEAGTQWPASNEKQRWTERQRNRGRYAMACEKRKRREQPRRGWPASSELTELSG